MNTGYTYEKTHKSIESEIKNKRQGELIFTSDFRGIGTDNAIKKALSRLAKEKLIKRLSRGIYYIPKIDPIIGEVTPSIDDVVQMIAEKDKIKIKPAGAYALHKLGLTTQVPTKRVYITDGNPKQFTIGKVKVKFKATTSKRLSRTGEISSLVIQAIEELGTDNIDKQTRTKIRELLQNESPEIIRHDLSLSSTKINNYIYKVLKEESV